MKKTIQRAFRKVGIEISRRKGSLQVLRDGRGFEILRKTAVTSAPPKPVMESFPPYASWSAVGKRENYFIHDGYRARTEPLFYDDTVNTDEWQNEVYRFAREVFDRCGLKTVADIGCGSGYKLVKYFRDCETIGLDLPETIEKVKLLYPDRKWVVCDFDCPPSEQPDLVISSDIIEHLPDPDLMLNYIRSLQPKAIVLSTPDRNLMMQGTFDGPPANPSHMREWNMAELHAYVGEYFHIQEHFISNPGQGTQCLLASLK